MNAWAGLVLNAVRGEDAEVIDLKKRDGARAVPHPGALVG
jgi:hypothetical protein